MRSASYILKSSSVIAIKQETTQQQTGFLFASSKKEVKLSLEGLTYCMIGKGESTLGIRSRCLGELNNALSDSLSFTTWKGSYLERLPEHQ